MTPKTQNAALSWSGLQSCTGCFVVPSSQLCGFPVSAKDHLFLRLEKEALKWYLLPRTGATQHQDLGDLDQQSSMVSQFGGWKSNKMFTG
jgi:hypothetical protein